MSLLRPRPVRERELSVSGCRLSVGQLAARQKAYVSPYKGVFCDKSFEIKKLHQNLAKNAGKMLILKSRGGRGSWSLSLSLKTDESTWRDGDDRE